MNYSNFIPWGISFLSLIVAALSFLRNKNKDTKEDYQKEEARLDGIKEGLLKANMKLDTVCATTNETRTDIKALNKDIADIDRRVTIVENNVKTAFKAIDELKERIGEA